MVAHIHLGSAVVTHCACALIITGRDEGLEGLKQYCFCAVYPSAMVIMHVVIKKVRADEMG